MKREKIEIYYPYSEQDMTFYVGETVIFDKIDLGKVIGRTPVKYLTDRYCILVDFYNTDEPPVSCHSTRLKSIPCYDLPLYQDLIEIEVKS